MFIHIEGPSKKWMSYFAIIGGGSLWAFTIHLILRPGIKTLWGLELVKELDANNEYSAFGFGRLFQVCWNRIKND